RGATPPLAYASGSERDTLRAPTPPPIWLPGVKIPRIIREDSGKVPASRRHGRAAGQPGEGPMVFLMPREEKFFDLFDEAADILVRASKKFFAMLSAFDRLQARADELKDEEHACDLVVERIIRALDRSFVTPLDREDIHRLATSLDNVL